jgi:hypothetical protein
MYKYIYLFSGTTYTIEGEKDVGKVVLKVKRGVVILGKITSYSMSRNSKDETLSSELNIINNRALSSSSTISIAPPLIHTATPSSSSGMPRNLPKSTLTDKNEFSSSSPSSSSPSKSLRNNLPEKKLEFSSLSSSAFGNPFSLYPSQSSPSHITSLLPRDSPSLPLPSPNRKDFHQDIRSNEREDPSSLIPNSGSMISDINNENASTDDDNKLEVNIPREMNRDNMNKERDDDHIQAGCISRVDTNTIRDNLDTNTGNDVSSINI